MERFIIAGLVVLAMASVAIVAYRARRKALDGFGEQVHFAALELVYVYAPGCSKCPAQKDVVNDIVSEYGKPGVLLLTVINAMENEESMRALGVRTVPSVMIRDAFGTVLFKQGGYVSRDQLRVILSSICA